MKDVIPFVNKDDDLTLCLVVSETQRNILLAVVKGLMEAIAKDPESVDIDEQDCEDCLQELYDLYADLSTFNSYEPIGLLMLNLWKHQWHTLMVSIKKFLGVMESEKDKKRLSFEHYPIKLFEDELKKINVYFTRFLSMVKE